MEIRVCNNCDWVGWLSETVRFKHGSDPFCPLCNETTETLTPQWFKEVRSLTTNAADGIENGPYTCPTCGYNWG